MVARQFPCTACRQRTGLSSADHIDKTFDHAGRLDGTPVLLGCHDQDPHIPLARVRTTQKIFGDLGAEVTTLISPGAGLGIVENEISSLLSILNMPGQ